MQNNNSIILIGNHIKKQIHNEKIVGIDDYLSFSDHNKERIAALGQGLSTEQINSVIDMVVRKTDQSFQKATRDLTHKSHEKNIMISDPLKFDETSYYCDLLIDDASSEMSDHLTGQHIQAMVLLEAARQMNIAVAEKYLIPSNLKGSVNFVLHQIKTCFYHYVYPLPALIEYHIDKFRLMPTGQFRSSVTIIFFQNEKKCLQVKLNYSVTDKIFLEDQECEDIERLVNRFINVGINQD